MTIGEFRHTNTFTRQRSKMSTVSNLDVAVSSFWQLARHWNQSDKAKLELSCENGSLHMQLSAVLSHPDQPHFPPPPHSPHHPPPPSFPPAPKKKSRSQLRRQKRRKNETSIKSQRAASKESASSNLDNGMASETAASSSAETEKDLPEYIDEGAEDANNSDKEDTTKCTETAAREAIGKTPLSFS